MSPGDHITHSILENCYCILLNILLMSSLVLLLSSFSNFNYLMTSPLSHIYFNFSYFYLSQFQFLILLLVFESCHPVFNLKFSLMRNKFCDIYWIAVLFPLHILVLIFLSFCTIWKVSVTCSLSFLWYARFYDFIAFCQK